MLRLAVPLVAAALATSLAACGSDSSTADGAAKKDGATLNVVTTFYPLQHAAERVGGSTVSVTNLTKPGADAHDLELKPKDAASIQQSSLLIYLKGFQPSVDASASSAPESFDVSSTANLSLHADDVTKVGVDAHEHGDEHGDEQGDEQGDHEGHDHGIYDPHFWLDPVRYASVVAAIGERFSKQDPKNASRYRSSAATFVKELTSLDGSFSSTLATCTSRELVTAHTAFGYLADRYKLHQVGVTAISPEQEPTPGRLKAVADYVRKHKVTTIYTEVLTSPAVAETVAKQTGAKVALLDPLEGLTDKSPAKDYVSVMKANLQALKKGQSCR